MLHARHGTPQASVAPETYRRRARYFGAMPDRRAWFGARWRACATTLSIWIRRSTTRRRLRELEGRLLEDIGRTELERRRECAKWFWRG